MKRSDFLRTLGLLGLGSCVEEDYMNVKKIFCHFSNGSQFDPDSYFDLLNFQAFHSSQFTLSGSKITTWNDGLGNILTQGTDAARPTLTAGIPLFDGGDTMAMSSDKNLGSVYSLYIIFRNTSNAISKIPVSSMAVNDYIMHAAAYELNMIGSASGGGGFGAKAGIGFKRYSVISIRRNGNATAKVRINDRGCILTASSFHASTGNVFGKLGDRFTGGFIFTGGIIAVCASSQYVDDTVNQQIVDALYTRYSLSSYTDAEIITGIGDSNTTGQGGTSYLVGLSSLMSLAYLNLGISGTLFTNVGATVNNGYDRWTNQIISKPHKDYLVVQYGTNEISMDRLPTYSTQLREKVNETITAGALPERICLCSIPYRLNNDSASTLSAWRDEIQDIASDYGTKFYDLLQDMRDNGGDALLVDTVHLNQTGQDLWRDGVYAAFTS